MVAVNCVLGLTNFRTRILEEKGVFGRIRLQMLIILLYIPYVIHAAVFVKSSTPEELLKPALDRYYGQYNNSGSGLYGMLDGRKEQILVVLLSLLFCSAEGALEA